MADIEIRRNNEQGVVPYREGDEEEEEDESIWATLANWNKKKAQTAKKKRFAEME